MDFEVFVSSFLGDKESFDLEYKSAVGGFPGSFWDTYSSFANTQGGMIVLGVKERNGRFFFDGLAADVVQKYIKEFWSCVNNKAHVSANIMKEDDVETVEYQGNKLVLFHVPRAARAQRPVYRTANPYNGTFKRNDEGDYKCTEQEVRRMFADADDTMPRDSKILEGFTMDDIDKESLAQYRNLFASVHPMHPWLMLGDEELLRKLGARRKDRVTGAEGFTLAGLLMFGKYDSIIENGCAPNYFPDFREVPDGPGTMRWADRICPDGTWEANLFQFYRRVLPKLTDMLPKPFRMENNLRIDDSPTHVAIREALINALIHADYSENCSIVIEKRKKSLTFSNPGNMLISIAQYYEGGESVCRNKSLQKMFMMIGTAEKAGSGVDKILVGWREENWQRPYVAERQRPDKVVLVLPMESFLPEQNVKELAGIFGDGVEHIGFNKLLTLSTCYAEEAVNNGRLKDILPLHSADITKMLKELCDDGYLVSVGVGRGTKYFINNKVDTSDVKVDTSGAKVDTSCAKVDTSCAKVDTSCAKVDTSELDSKARFGKEELEKLILSKAQDYATIEEIATCVGRSVDYIKNKVMPRMVKEGKMVRLHQKINHPNQKYKAK